MMKIICERDALVRVLSFVAGRANSKLKIPILTHVKMVAADDRLSLAATDLTAKNEGWCGAEIAAPGATTVVGERLARLVDLMPQGAQVQMELRGNDLHIRCWSSRYKLPTLPIEDFPEFPGPADAEEFSLGCVDAKRMFSDAQAAITVDGSRKYLEGGCLYQLESGVIALSGANGPQFVRRRTASNAALSGRYTIPKGSMNDIVRLAAEGEMTFRADANKIEVRRGNFILITKLVEGEYPNVERVIPPQSERFITVERGALAAAYKRLSGLIAEHSTIDIAWKGDENEIEISLAGDGTGTERVACSCDIDQGSISFAPSILGPMLDLMKGETLQLHFNGSTRPMLLIDPSDPDLTVLAMPCAPRKTQPQEATAA